MMSRKALCLFILFFSLRSYAEIKTVEVSYREDDTLLKGMLAYDDAIEGKRPGVLVVHEWWGQNDYARRRAKMLAELGYTALAVDMYGDGKTADHPKDASAFSSAVGGNLPLAKARFDAALNLLKKDPTVDAARIAAIGYCFGGGIVINMARMGEDLAGVVSFHGSLGTNSPAKKGDIKTRLLVLNGAEDPFTKPQQIAAFKKEMDDAGADYRFVNYPGAKHSFTNPDADKFGKEFGLPLEYNEQADKDSWQQMQDFFREIFSN